MGPIEAGRKKEMEGDMEGAEEIYKELLRRHPDHVDGMAYYAILLGRLARLEEATSTASAPTPRTRYGCTMPRSGIFANG